MINVSPQLLTPINGPLGKGWEKKCIKKRQRKSKKKIYIEKNNKKKVCGVGIPEPVSQSVLGFYPLLKM